MGKNDRRLALPAVYLIEVPEVNIERKRYGMPYKISGKLYGRPVKVLKRIIDLGFQHKFFSKEALGNDLIKELIIFGFDRGYWKDTSLLSASFEYFIKDMNFSKSKAERLKEMEEFNGIRK